MKKLLRLALIITFLGLFFFQNQLFSQIVGEYRSKTTGGWSSSLSWEVFNGSTWVDATEPPDHASIASIRNGHTIYVGSQIDAWRLTVDVGGILNIGYSTDRGILWLRDDLHVYGKVTVTYGYIDISLGGSIFFESGSECRLLGDANYISSIPEATWDANSLCYVSGIETHMLNSLDFSASFGNFTWNCLNQSVTQYATFQTIKGDLNILKGNLLYKKYSGVNDMIVYGDLEIGDNASFNLGNSGNNVNQLENMFLNGDLTVLGELKKTDWNIPTKIIFNNNGSQLCYLNTANDYKNIDWRVNTNSTVVLQNNFTVGLSRTLEVLGLLNTMDYVVTGSGKFISRNGSTLGIYNSDGIYSSAQTGIIQVSGLRTYEPSTNYYFYASTNINAGDALISANNITIDILPGSLKLNTDLNLTGNIHIPFGKLDLVDNTLILSESVTLENETSSHYITATAGGKIITSRNISNVTNLNIAGMGFKITTSADLGATIIEKHFDPVSNNYITGIARWYKITPTNNTDLNATIIFSYHPWELNGVSEAELSLFKSEDQNSWQSIESVLNTTNNTLTASGINTFSYFTASDGLNSSVNAKIFLEGPYSDGTMSTTLSSSELIPLSQPYNTAPWNYAGTESVASIPPDVVDWVLVELRTGTAAETKVAERAGFLKNNAIIVDTEGISQLCFTKLDPDDYYIVIKHRNHLSVMSANAVSLSSSSTLYDFTTAQAQAYGTNPMADLGDGTFGMIAGDANYDFQVTSTDFNLFNPKFKTAMTGYQMEDWNLDGQITSTDFNVFNINFKQARTSQVP